MDLKELLKKGYDIGGSDIFIVPGAKVSCKVKGGMVHLTDSIIMPAQSEELIREAYELAHRDISLLQAEGDDDFSFPIRDVSRFRCNAYFQRGTMAATCRMISFGLPDPRELQIPDVIAATSQVGIDANTMLEAVQKVPGVEILQQPWSAMGYVGKPAGYMVVFCFCAVAYLIAWCIMKALVPRYSPIKE